MNEYDEYRKREEAKRRAAVVVSGIITICAAVGAGFVAWFLASFLFALFAGLG